MESVWTVYSNGMPSVAPVRRMFAEQTINFVRYSDPKVKAYVVVNGQSIANDFNAALDEYGATPEEKDLVQAVQIPNQTIWHIDFGPFPIIHKDTDTLAFADFVYYHPRHIDDAMPARIGHDFYKDVTLFHMPFPFEGGNIQSDGEGMCATTNRALSNTGFSELKVANLLKKYAACEETVVVKDITDDGTGHIDMFFKWADVDHVIFGAYEDEITYTLPDGATVTVPLPGSVAPDYASTYATNKKRMDDNAALFAGMTAANGKPFKVSRLSMMTRFRDNFGNLPRTFINSTFTNGVNVYPSYSSYSCVDAGGAPCTVDADCGGNEYCAVGKCTGKVNAAQTAVGCDALMPCPSGLECVEDPLKVALKAQVQDQWQEALPEMTHVGLTADRIALWSGAIHCITRTIPNKKFAKVVDDGQCIDGTCGCVEGGYTGACGGDDDCYGPQMLCGCDICFGKCPGGNNCTDDADCAMGGNIVEGSCAFDPAQPCYGEEPEPLASCGNLPAEGMCVGNKLSWCDNGQAKQLECATCCGWDAGNKFFNCINDPAICAETCIDECSNVGETGCSVALDKAWVCVEECGCKKRKFMACEGGKCEASLGGCSAIGGDSTAWDKPQCDPDYVAPDGPDPVCPGDEPDAGATEPDAGGSTDGTGSPDTVSGEDAGGAGNAGGGSGGGGDSGCTAAHTSGSSAPVWLLFAMVAALVWRRRGLVG
jgi:agmatine/peptidylarginine deiminase